MLSYQKVPIEKKYSEQLVHRPLQTLDNEIEVLESQFDEICHSSNTKNKGIPQSERPRIKVDPRWSSRNSSSDDSDSYEPRNSAIYKDKSVSIVQLAANLHSINNN